MIFAGVLGQLLLTWAAFRGGLVRWWVPALMTAGMVLSQIGSDWEGVASAQAYLPVVLAGVLFAAALLRPTPVPSVPGAVSEPSLAVG